LASEKKSADVFEAALKRELQSAPLSNAADCPAPATIAAYYDRSLSRGERAGVDLHLVSCARCQSMMASIARADDADRSLMQPEPARGFFWITRLLAPVAVVGVVIAIAIGMRARERRAPEVIALASPIVSPKLELAERAAPPPFEIASKAPAAPQAASAPQAVGVVKSQKAARLAREEKAQKKSAPPLVAKSALSRTESFSATVQAQSAPAAAASAMAAPGAAMGAAVSGATTMMAAKAPSTNQISSPDGSVAWQFGVGGAILRSSNSGPWLAQPSGVTTDLLAGSAPSSDVCWMVGKSGTIVRTLDNGAHWRLVKAPSLDDYTRISATDSNNATVAAANGQSFTTHDGGVTWSSP